MEGYTGLVDLDAGSAMGGQEGGRNQGDGSMEGASSEDDTSLSGLDGSAADANDVPLDTSVAVDAEVDGAPADPTCPVGQICADDCDALQSCVHVCSANQTCRFACGASQACQITCQATSICYVEWTSGANQVDCQIGARCALVCGSGIPTCSFSTCAGGATSGESRATCGVPPP